MSTQIVFFRSTSDFISYIRWSGTFSTDNLTDQPASAGAPATLVFDGQQHVFYRGETGDIDHIWWEADSTITRSDNWTTASNAPTAAGDPATMVYNNQQHVFYRGDTGDIDHIWWTASDNKTRSDDWTAATGAPPATGTPATLVYPNAQRPDQQHVFYRSTSGDIDHVWWTESDDTLRTDNWTQRTGAPEAAGDPATLLYPNQQHVFYRSISGDIHHIWWTESDNTLRTDNWTQKSGATRAAGDPATMVTSGQQHVFYRGTDGDIHHIWWSESDNKLRTDNWTANAKGAPPAAGDPCAMVVNQQQHVFYRGADDKIYHIWWSASDNKTRWDNWTGKSGAALASTSDLACNINSGFVGASS